MESFEKHWKLALAISCETIGLIGMILILILSGAPKFYLNTVMGDIILIGSLVLFLFGLGMLIVPLLRNRKKVKFELFYEDRVRSHEKDDH